MIKIKGNPYSIDQPAEALFYGRQEQVDKLVANLTTPTAGSFALIGGRRFGKTSLLRAIERQLWAAFVCPTDEAYRVIPVYINLLGDEIESWSDFFPLVIDILADQIAEHCSDIVDDSWITVLPANSGRPVHRIFAKMLIKLCQSAARSGNPVRVLLLLDETEEILDKAWRTELFNKLRWLIYEEPSTRNYLKIILAGSSNFYNDTRQSSSPLWGAVTFEFLMAFSEQETRRLIQEPCDSQVPELIERDIVQYSGGHPYIVQYLMHHLWQDGLPEIPPRRVAELSERFMREQWPHFNRWSKSIGAMGCQAYSILLSRAEWTKEGAIRQAIGGPTPELVPALTALCYHGWAIHDAEWRYLAVGELFRDWFTRNVGLGLMRDTVQEHRGENFMDTISILFLAADPTNASRLRLGEEFREIDEQLTLAKQRDHFNLALPQLSLRPKDIARALLNVQPQIVHFSGHGTAEGALCFENEIGQTHLVQPDALAALFEQFADQVNCVLLNACYSEIQAKEIAEYVEFVIGMNQAIGDKAAIAFAIGFYQALGAGRSIEEAYKLGCVQIRLQGIPEHLTPVLVKKGQAKPLPQEATELQSTVERRQPLNGVAISLKFNEEGLAIEDEQEIKAALVEALFATENQAQVTFDVELEPLEVVKACINSIESEDASPENRIIKVNLLRQARALEAKHKAATLALSLLLLPPLRHHFVSVDELIECLNGLARLSFDFQCDQSTSSLSLDIYRKDDPKLNTVIWIDETEQEESKTHSGWKNIFAVLRIGCDLLDLPINIRFRKAIPAIVLMIAFEAIRTGQDVHNLIDLSKVLDLYSWSVGLH